MYINRTEADVKPGTRTVGALNWLIVRDDQALDILPVGDGNLVYVNASDTAIAAGGTEIPARSSLLKSAEGDVEIIDLPDGSRMYANYSDAMVKTDNSNKRNVAAGNYLIVTEAIDLDLLILPDGDLWVNGTDTDFVSGDITVPAKGTARTAAGDAAAEIIILPDGSRRYVNRGTAPLVINKVNLLGMCWAPDAGQIQDAPLPDGLEAVRYINFSDADVVFGAVSIPAGQVVDQAPEPAIEEAPEEAVSEEGGM